MPGPRFEFHVSRASRDRYRFDRDLFSLTGNVVFADLAASREFARRMNLDRDTERHPERAVQPGALNAMALIDEAMHAVVALYREHRDPRALIDALEWFEGRLGREALDTTLLAFAQEFPPGAIYRGGGDVAAWLGGETGGVPHRAVVLEELLLLWLANLSPAFQPFGELFDDSALERDTSYGSIVGALHAYFDTRPRFGPLRQNLVDLLRAPALASPDSLEGQLAYIEKEWRELLGDLVRRMLTALDVLKEEQVAIWMRFHPARGAPGAAPAPGPSGAEWIPSYGAFDREDEAFSPDSDWMPRTVLVAKSVWVWLHQLSVRHGREIARLDQVPDEELDLLARRGFNALWLIGVWERGRASQRIKQMCGNPEALASAYSLNDYAIAPDLGGDPAYLALRDRAAARGLRLASDMVPNHMAVDSRWVIEHPDWFLQLRGSPFPAYRFEGPDLSNDGRVEIKIEDHYYDRSDAAVVFRRVDRGTGEARYLYHGNDGTSFPWNDTAQLDYTRPEVRAAVIDTILHVARRFPIIRFDAAMTLAKRHYQRLWFPEPGSGGAIPSRAEHGLSHAEFDVRMPHEFWREVVDRVAAEAPGTLLLAEAFWLMEGYFVRTLGMHRVYNSAFMNMLRDEQNTNYRSVIKNTLEFDPEVLKRYVNFMNNPDERTAVEQFGKGDKYFGICTLMSTLPGLPMFGHGQFEGFTEKYGMEYRRSYHDESPDSWLVERHEREISPLLHQRALFAEAREFLLYDFFTERGHVNEDVFAYSNRHGHERALVVYHNRFAATRGWIRLSCAYAEKTPDGGKRLRQRSLGDALGLSNDPAMLVAFRDARTGLEFLRRAPELAAQGLRFELEAYECHVFLDWRDLKDDGRPWRELCDLLDGRGVSSLEDAIRELELKPLHDALRAVLSSENAAALARRAEGVEPGRAPPAEVVPDAGRRMRTLLAEAQRLQRLVSEPDPATAWRGDVGSVVLAFERRLEAALKLPSLEPHFSAPWPAEARAVLPSARARGSATTAVADHALWTTVLASCALEALGRFRDPSDPDAAATQVFDALRLRGPLAERFAASGLEGDERWRAAARVRAGFAHAARAPGVEAPRGRPAAACSGVQDPDVAWAIGVHEHEGVRYFVREAFERLLWWLALRPLLDIAGGPRTDLDALRALEHQLSARSRAAHDAGYRVEALLESGQTGSPSPG